MCSCVCAWLCIKERKEREDEEKGEDKAQPILCRRARSELNALPRESWGVVLIIYWSARYHNYIISMMTYSRVVYK